MPNQYGFNDPKPFDPFSAWRSSPYVQQILANTGIPLFGNEKSKLPTGYIDDPGNDPSKNIFTQGWFDGGGTWHPFASDFAAQRSIPTASPDFLKGPATQSYAGGPQVPIDASQGNPNYSPFSTSYAPASTGTQAYDQYGNPSTTKTNLPDMTFGSRYLQGTNYASGDPNAPAGIGGRFWQTLAQNQARWQPSPTAQELMAKNVPQVLGNTINLTAPSALPSSNPTPSQSPLNSVRQKSKSTLGTNPLFGNQSQPYVGSAAWSAMRGMR